MNLPQLEWRVEESRVEEEQGVLSHTCLQPALQAASLYCSPSRPPVNRPTQLNKSKGGGQNRRER